MKIYKIIYWDIGEPDKEAYVEANSKKHARKVFFCYFPESCFVKSTDELKVY